MHTWRLSNTYSILIDLDSSVLFPSSLYGLPMLNVRSFSHRNKRPRCPLDNLNFDPVKVSRCNLAFVIVLERCSVLKLKGLFR